MPSPILVLPREVFFKHWREAQAFYHSTLGLEEEGKRVVSEMVRLWMIRGEVYPTAKQLAEAAQVGVRTVWRTINRLEELKMVQVVNRYVKREWAQISNLFRIEKLIIALARYLAERTECNLGPMMKRFLALPGQEFWTEIWRVDNLWELVGNVRPIRAV